MLYSTSQLKVLKSHYTYIWLILSAISFSLRACIAPSISREEVPPKEKWYLCGEKSGHPYCFSSVYARGLNDYVRKS